MRGDARFERGGFRRRLECVAELCVMMAEIERFRPVGAWIEKVGGVAGDDAVLRFEIVDHGARFNRKMVRHGGLDFAGTTGLVGKVEFVEIDSGGFPIFVEAEREIEFSERAQRVDVTADLIGFRVAIVAVQIEPGGVFARAEGKPRGIQNGEERDVEPADNFRLAEEFQRGEWPGGFVSVDAGGNVEARGVRRGGVKLEPRAFPIADGTESMSFPTVLCGGTEGVFGKSGGIERHKIF